MVEGYCVKCKAKKEVIDAVETVMKNGRKAIKGKCPDCATVMFKILGGKLGSPGEESSGEQEPVETNNHTSFHTTTSTLPPITGAANDPDESK